MKERKLLLVEDDELTRLLVHKGLEQLGYQVSSVGSVPEALCAFHQNPVQVVLSDIEMKPVSGFELLKQFSGQVKPPLFIFMTGRGSLTSACDAISMGAFDYLGKPVQIEQLRAVIERAFVELEMSPRNSVPIEESDLGLVGRSPQMVEVYRNVARASRCDSNVLICGESGTGKELIARAIHGHSSRKNNRFVTVNCGALTETLLESELFGHLKGSFTGAISNKKGLFEEANGGTLFLDEIGDISPGLQVKLLRVIQEGEYKPVGSVENRRTNVRVITATHRNLPLMVQEEKFREDLFYRLKVLYLQLPPLRERVEDVVPLAQYFLAKRAQADRKCVLSPEAIEKIMAYHWPGNIRELEHCIERAVVMSQSCTLYADDFLFSPQTSVSDCKSHKEWVPTLKQQEEPHPESPLISLEELEKRHIQKIVRLAHFNKTRAAQVLGIDRATLYRKAERYGINLGPNEAVNPAAVEI
ncbi:MAG: sigma-54-dependent Fis family transcriptional regulator [Proteobacteria bacterium]|nr:sigma-54-dependent Fis family transcriptional regulator [Pseudomonadota bacterium]